MESSVDFCHIPGGIDLAGQAPLRPMKGRSGEAEQKALPGASLRE